MTRDRPGFWQRQIRVPVPRQDDVYALLGFVALALCLFPTAVFHGEAFYERDIQFDWYPQVEAFVRAVARGSWPLWDNAIGFGQPLLADPSAEILYPPAWLRLLLPPWTYYTLSAVAHFVFSAVGLYFLGGRLGLSRRASFVSGCVWVTSGPFLSLLNLYHHYAGAAWLPWVLLAAVAAADSPRMPQALLWGAAIAGQILAGSADMCAMTQLLAAAVVLLRLDWRRPGSVANRSLLGRAVLAWVLAVGLTAALWLPSLEVAQRSARWNLPDASRTFRSVPLLGMLQVLLPVFAQGLPLRAEPRQALFPFGDPLLASIYLGMPSLGLVLAAACGERRRHVAVLACASLVAALAALGSRTAVYAVLVTALPPLRILRYPSKSMIVAAAGWALAAGMGLDAWRSAEVSGKRWALWVLVPISIVAAVGGAGVWLLGSHAETWAGQFLLREDPTASFAVLLSPIRRSLGLATALSGCVLALGALRSAGGRVRGAASGLAALGADADLAGHHASLNRTAPAELLAFRPPVLDFVRQDDRSRLYVYDYAAVQGQSERLLGRDEPYLLRLPEGIPLERAQILSQRLYPYPSSAGRWGFESSYDLDFRGLHPLPLVRLTELLWSAEGTPLHLRLLRIGAVKHVVALHDLSLEGLHPVTELPGLLPEPIRVFRVPEPLGRCYAVGGVRVAGDEEARHILRDPAFDPTREVILADGKPAVADASFAGRSRILDLQPDRIRLEAELSGPGVLVLVDSYDPGWRVSVDGREARMERANLAFRGVRVTAGRHIITYVYRPRGVTVGVVVSLGTLGLAVILAVGRHNRP